MTIDEHAEIVRKALRASKRYNKGLEPQIASAAGVMRTLELANADIDQLKSTTVTETSRYGKKVVAHPAFKVQRDAQDAVTRQLKALGLTIDDLKSGEQDPLADMTKALKSQGTRRRKAETIKPDIEEED